MEGLGRPPSYQAEAKTLWLAGDDPSAARNMLPFGWILVEVTPEGTEPPRWPESFAEYHELAREWREKLDVLLSELRAQQAEVGRRPYTTEGFDRRGAEARGTEAAAFADAFLDRLRNFKSSELGELRQLIHQCESRPDRDECLRALATRLLELYGADKRQLKALRAKFPALAPYLVKP